MSFLICMDSAPCSPLKQRKIPCKAAEGTHATRKGHCRKSQVPHAPALESLVWRLGSHCRSFSSYSSPGNRPRCIYIIYTPPRVPLYLSICLPVLWRKATWAPRHHWNHWMSWCLPLPTPPACSCPSPPLPHLAWVSCDNASRAGACSIWETGGSPWLRTKGWHNLPSLLWLGHQVGVGDVRLPPSQLHCRVTLPLWAGGGVLAGHGCSSPSWPGLPPFSSGN